MKHRILEIICCPHCSGELRLAIFKQETTEINSKFQLGNSVSCRRYCGLLGLPTNDVTPSACIDCYKTEIMDGSLSCECGYICPIIDGIPRLLTKGLLAEILTRYHQDFIGKYPIDIPVDQGRAPIASKKVATMHAFGYQWTTFTRNFDYFKDIFLSFVQPFLQPADFHDKLVLEVGCGSGRPASVASSFGAEVVAVDLSEAVQTAYAQSKQFPKLHVIQADAYSLPLRPCFDFVYSVGVLQHLPDPQAAIKSIARVVPPNHKFVIWVYGKREIWYRPVDWLRKLSVKMPHPLLHGLSYVLALLSEVFLLMPYRILSRFKPMQTVAVKIPGHIYANFPFKENVLGWFDRLGAPVTFYFSKEDVESMLANADFHQINVVPRPGASASWIAQATKIT